MILKFIIIISILINIIMFILIKNKNKQIVLANKIRIGYEKRCNSFRIRYTILSKMEDNDKVAKRVRDLNTDIYIYGGGVIGKKLNKILNDSDIYVLGIIESKDMEYGKMKINEDAIIIVTPVFDYDNIISQLGKITDTGKIISIDEVL